MTIGKINTKHQCIGYLVSQYPAASHTFIRREVEELDRFGIPLATFSVRRPAADERLSPEDAAAFQATSYLLPIRPFAIVTRQCWALTTNPVQYLKTLRLAFRHRAPGAKALLWSVFHFSEAIVLAQDLKSKGVSHLHTHFANSGATVGMLAATYLRLPWSLTLHGISETDYPAGLLLSEKVSRATFVACVSWFGQAQAMRMANGRDWGKFLIVRCGLNMFRLQKRAQREQRHSEVPRIICVGRISPEKGHLGLLHALLTLNDRGVKFRLILVGDGPERRAIERQFRESAIGSDVEFMGRLAEEATLEQISKANLLVLPSFMEGLPIVLMEAMGLGVPVIGPRLAGVPELIEDREEGLLFTPSNWLDLADKLHEVLVDSKLAAGLAEAARRKVEHEFSLERALLPLVEKFKEVLALPAIGGKKGGGDSTHNQRGLTVGRR